MRRTVPARSRTPTRRAYVDVSPASAGRQLLGAKILVTGQVVSSLHDVALSHLCEARGANRASSDGSHPVPSARSSGSVLDLRRRWTQTRDAATIRQSNPCRATAL